MSISTYTEADQLTLGELINLLKMANPQFYVRFGTSDVRLPTKLHSYRGIYEHLALGYDDKSDITVFSLVEILNQAVGKKFNGWKGGQYTMTYKTPIWMANANESDGKIITGLRFEDGGIILEVDDV